MEELNSYFERLLPKPGVWGSASTLPSSEINRLRRGPVMQAQPPLVLQSGCSELREGLQDLPRSGRGSGLRVPSQGRERRGARLCPALQVCGICFSAEFCLYLVSELFISTAHISSFGRLLTGNTALLLGVPQGISCPWFQMETRFSKPRGLTVDPNEKGCPRSCAHLPAR